MYFLIDKSFATGIFPDSLKISVITPIYKNGDTFLYLRSFVLQYRFFSYFGYSQTMSYLCQKWKKIGGGVTDFVFEIKRIKNYPNFDKSALVTRHGLSHGLLVEKY